MAQKDAFILVHCWSCFMRKKSLSGGGAVVQLVSPHPIYPPPPLSSPAFGYCPFAGQSWLDTQNVNLGANSVSFSFWQWIWRREAFGTGEGLSSQVENIAGVIRELIAWVLWGIQGDKLEEGSPSHQSPSKQSGAPVGSQLYLTSSSCTCISGRATPLCPGMALWRDLWLRCYLWTELRFYSLWIDQSFYKEKKNRRSGKVKSYFLMFNATQSF